jgi:hypothetical protein
MKRNVLEGLKWTLDCQGKQDFDGEIVSLSTRYWPRGGGFTVLEAGPWRWEENKDRPEIKPSANASIMLLGKELVSQDFEAETEAEVKQLVEAWARTEIERIAATVTKLFEGN